MGFFVNVSYEILNVSYAIFFFGTIIGQGVILF